MEQAVTSGFRARPVSFSFAGGLRRAVVRPGTGQLLFVNVPSGLLRKVMGRLHRRRAREDSVGG
jgi:hypothetical protein